MEERRASQRVSSRTEGTFGRVEVDGPAEGVESLSEVSPEVNPAVSAEEVTRGVSWLLSADADTLPGLASKVGPLPLPLPPPRAEGTAAAAAPAGPLDP